LGLRVSIAGGAPRVFRLTPADTQVLCGEAVGRPADGFFNQS
ncbi:cell division protein SepF, partial [Streptomyces sp. NPDC001455]